MKTSNNTIFISGGSAGIGFEIARQFAAKGNKVIINGRNKERLDKALQQLPGAVAIQGDLSVESERIRIAEELKKNYPELNVLINNAGEAYAYSLSDSGKASEFAQKEINTNYIAVIHFSELLLPHLLTKPEAAIVNVTSIVAFMAAKRVATYAASKAALRSYTQALRQWLEDTNVKVFELLPPLVNTDFSAEIGGANGIPPKEVADELLLAFENDQYEVPVGQTKFVHAAVSKAFAQLA